jgi:hypothetical protein
LSINQVRYPLQLPTHRGALIGMTARPRRNPVLSASHRNLWEISCPWGSPLTIQ